MVKEIFHYRESMKLLGAFNKERKAQEKKVSTDGRETVFSVLLPGNISFHFIVQTRASGCTHTHPHHCFYFPVKKCINAFILFFYLCPKWNILNTFSYKTFLLFLNMEIQANGHLGEEMVIEMKASPSNSTESNLINQKKWAKHLKYRHFCRHRIEVPACPKGSSNLALM